MGKEEIQKLIERMKELGYNSHMIRLAKELVNELQQRGIYGIDRFVKKLSDRANEKQDYLDTLREGRFAIILARNGFSGITFIKERKEQRLPDIKANYNKCTVYFEVTRSRPNEEDEKVQSGAAFVSPKRIENIKSKIQDKIPQLRSGEINIIVFWSDTVGVLLPDIEEAFKYIQQEIDQNLGAYKELSGILFTESGEASYPTEFKLFKNDKASKSLGNCLTKKLEPLLGRDPEELQRDRGEMAAALKQLGSSRN